jgi:hypothetical protein
MSSYKPLTPKEATDLMRPPLIDEGRYQFEVVEVHNTDQNHNPLVDKQGEPMTKLRLKIWDNEGRERSLYTYLFWGASHKMAYRTRYFAESIGMLDKYDSGVLLDEMTSCLSRTGIVEIYIQKERDKNDGSGDKWPAKNEVRNFIVASEPEKTENAAGKKSDFDDDVPF